MRKRSSIIGALLLSTITILSFFLSVVLFLWVNQKIDMEEGTTTNSSLTNFFLHASSLELFFIFLAATFMTFLVLYKISTNIKSNFSKFNKFFYDAAYGGKLIDKKDLNFKEFETLAEAVNSMILRVNEKRKKIIFNEKYLQTVLDAQRNIVLVKSHGELEKANQAFYSFMNVTDLDEFKTSYKCISQFFEKDKEYLSNKVDGVPWVNYILENPLKSHKVKIVRDNKDFIFDVKANVAEVQDDSKTVITFHNISELEEQKRAFEKASTIDSLTRVANRMKFDTILEQQVEMSKRYDHSFCLILLDIDNFKKINDTYGHKIGDSILIEMAMIIKNSMRKSDTFARWGGEEFAIILPQARLKTAVKIAEKFRKKIDNNTFDENLHVTCSFGVCEYKKSFDVESIVKCADEMLYKSKHNGKNQVSF